MQNEDVLPNDFVSLKTIIDRLKNELKSKEQEIIHLRLQLFAPKSEKLPRTHEQQPGLFDEAEQGADPEPVAPPVEDIVVTYKRKKKPGRKPLPKNIPRRIIEVDLAEEKKFCGCGQKLTHIGVDMREELDVIPATVKVNQYNIHKYVCACCKGTSQPNESPVKTAKAPLQAIPRSIFSHRLMAYMMTSKYIDAIPFYRQCAILQRYGVPLDRTTLCNLSLKIGQLLAPLVEFMRQDMLKDRLLGIDETKMLVMREHDKANTALSYMWLFRGEGPPGKVKLIYQYQRSRSGEVVRKFIGNYQGYIQSDGYAGYAFLDHLP